MLQHGVDGRPDVRHVCRVALGPLRGADGDEVQVALGDRAGIGGEDQPPGGERLGEDLLEAGLVEGCHPLPSRSTLAASMSRPTTSWPSPAMQAAWTAPR